MLREAKMPVTDAPGGMCGEAAARGAAPWSSRYRFGEKGEYEVILADPLEERLRAWRLVYRSYAAKGYARPAADELWYGLHDALPSTRTFIVTREGQDVATLSLVFDSPLGLPADQLYADELDGLRRQGRRPCEIISLASEETSRARAVEVLKHLFKLAYLTAWRIEDATDLVITVNPHHTGYYERRLLFVRQGEERSYGKVGGAPAVLMRLGVTDAEARYEAAYGNEEGSFYRFFCDPATERPILAFLRDREPGLTADEVEFYFDVNRPLLSDASAELRAYIRGLYRREVPGWFRGLMAGWCEPMGDGAIPPFEQILLPAAGPDGSEMKNEDCGMKNEGASWGTCLAET